MTKMIPEDDFSEEQFFRPVQKPSANPLQQFFRMPGCHVPLPTRGAFLPPEAFDPTLAGDVPVFPMKAADELLLRSPDALMSGYALEKLIESCVPAIRAPRLVSTPDLDVLLLAIRAATYGDKMDIEIACPKCGHMNLFECDLPSMMGKMTFIEPNNPVKLSKEVTVMVRPYTLAAATRAALGSFNEVRALQAIEDEEERRVATNASYDRMSKLNLAGIADSIIAVQTPNGDVTDREFIAEFINNTSQAWVKKIDKRLGEINALGIDKHVDATCSKCAHGWSPEVEFDPSSFFEPSS